MLGIFGLFLQAAAGHILYLALHLESGSFPRPLPPDRERAAFADLQKGGAAAAQARDTLIRHNLRLVAHICKKYYAGNTRQPQTLRTDAGIVPYRVGADSISARAPCPCRIRPAGKLRSPRQSHPS